MCSKLYNSIAVISLFVFALLLCCGQTYGAAASLNRHSRYVPVSPSEFNCSGIPDGYFIHQSSCSIFYACVGGNAYKSECFQGLLFNTGNNGCESEHLVNCSKITVSPTKTTTSLQTLTTSTMPTTTMMTTTMPATTTMPTTTTMSTTRRTTTLPAISQVSCSGKAPGYLLRNPSDCTKYFECTGDAIVPFPCAGNLVFNEKIQGCDYRQNVPECKI